MKRNSSALATACVVAILSLSGCAGGKSWMPWSNTPNNGAAVQQGSGTQGYSSHTGSRVDPYKPLEVHEPR